MAKEVAPYRKERNPSPYRLDEATLLILDRYVGFIIRSKSPYGSIDAYL